MRGAVVDGPTRRWLLRRTDEALAGLDRDRARAVVLLPAADADRRPFFELLRRRIAFRLQAQGGRHGRRVPEVEVELDPLAIKLRVTHPPAAPSRATEAA